MGEVHRARDSRLGREVAIRVLAALRYAFRTGSEASANRFPSYSRSSAAPRVPQEAYEA